MLIKLTIILTITVFFSSQNLYASLQDEEFDGVLISRSSQNVQFVKSNEICMGAIVEACQLININIPEGVEAIKLELIRSKIRMIGPNTNYLLRLYCNLFEGFTYSEREAGFDVIEIDNVNEKLVDWKVSVLNLVSMIDQENLMAIENVSDLVVYIRKNLKCLHLLIN